MGKHATFPAAVHVLLRDAEGKILFMRRTGTKLYDGWLGLPAGHVDAGEFPHDAAAREMKEELGLDVDVSFADAARSNRLYGDGHMYFDTFYDLGTGWLGRPVVKESGKCSGLEWLDGDVLPADVIPYEADAIRRMAAGQSYFCQELDETDESAVPPSAGAPGDAE